MKYQNYILFLLAAILIVAIVDKCDSPKPIRESKIDTIEIIKQKIDTVKAEVVKLKEGKTKIIYRTKFDTLATVDTVLVELLKCDTIIKIDSVIIAKQDTIIKGQEEIIFEQDLENQHQEKENKRLKGKLIFTKVIAGVLIILSIIAMK